MHGRKGDKVKGDIWCLSAFSDQVWFPISVDKQDYANRAEDMTPLPASDGGPWTLSHLN